MARSEGSRHVAVTREKSTRAEEALALSQTRLCIKNLPKQFTEHDVRQFVLKTASGGGITVTDCRVLKKPSDGKSRRMAFVGFASQKQANHAKHKLHRAYCQTSRLTVEYAHLPKQQPEAATDKEEDNEKEDASEKKKKADSVVDMRKEEFLSAMGVSAESTTSRRKFWANDDKEEEKEKKRQDVATPVEGSSNSSSEIESENSSNDESSVDDADPLAGQSDMDYLRSKQVQVENFDSSDEEVRAKKDKGSSSEEDSSPSSDDESSSESSDIEEDEAVTPEQDTMKDTTDSAPPIHDTIDKRSKEDSEERHDKESTVRNRLFLRNLPFSATEHDIQGHFEAYGHITEVHVPVDDHKRSKGFAFVTFEKDADAETARIKLDGHDFQGRLLHILPARKAPTHDDDPDDSTNLTYKEKQDRKRQREAGRDTTGWSASFVRGDAVVDNLASRLGLRKGDILAVKDGLSAGDAAVRLALAESAIIEENRKYFAEHGIDMEALVSLKKIVERGDKKAEAKIPRSNNAFLVKNLPHDTTKTELLKVFSSAGSQPTNILLPPSRTIAVVEYSNPNDAKVSFRRMAYRRFKSVPLYLEWTPLSSMDSAHGGSSKSHENLAAEDENDEALIGKTDEENTGPTATIYVKNLNFSTTEDQLLQLFSKHVKDVRAVRIPRKAMPVKRKVGYQSNRDPEIRQLSMGYGFVEFGSQESVRKVMRLLQGMLVDGHSLELKPSSNSQDQEGGPTKSSKSSSKLMVRNVPFQATRQDLLKLFGSFGRLKKVRLPKKFDGTHRGFAFVEYLGEKDAAAAMKAFSRTHLYGRHLVIEWAAKDEETDNLETLREKAERDVMAASTERTSL
jgi:multiple RNA-binding domain-containing protein 1